MTANPLKEFERLREAMLRRKAEIEAELKALEAVLGGKTLPQAPASSRQKPKGVRNAISLGDAVFSVTKDAPLSKKEILTALKRRGYRFSPTSSPIEEVSVVLHFDKRFEIVNGKYAPTLTALFPQVSPQEMPRAARELVSS